MFATASLARRIERAECSLITDGARATAKRLEQPVTSITPLSGGVAVFAETGSPFNKLVGLGFDGVPSEDALRRIEQAFQQRACAVQVELSSLGDPAVARMLTQRGYELVGFENVLGLPLTDDVIATLPAGPDARSVEVRRAGPEDVQVWTTAVTDGFLHPDTFDGPPSHESFDREVLERVFGDTASAGYELYLAHRDGAVAGGASLRMSDGVAQLCGASTLPEHRRHGVQTSLLRYRLTKAARRGCDVAVVTTQPGSKSQQNVQRFGFAVLYARAILVKPA